MIAFGYLSAARNAKRLNILYLENILLLRRTQQRHAAESLSGRRLKEGYLYTIRSTMLISSAFPLSAVPRETNKCSRQRPRWRRVNINLLPIECDRAAGELTMTVRRVAVSQR